jgi:hypothetical protein
MAEVMIAANIGLFGALGMGSLVYAVAYDTNPNGRAIEPWERRLSGVVCLLSVLIMASLVLLLSCYHPAN